jgi:hypothetical protein
MGETELANAASVVAEGIRVFSVINLWDGRQVNDRMREYLWNRYVRTHGGGPAWNNQDLSKQGIYFVDAVQACNGRYDNDEEKVEASGLAEFERSLMRFLVRERQQVHLKKSVTLADKLASVIDMHISQRQKAAQLGRGEAQAVELNPREGEERNRFTAALTEAATAVAQHRLALRQALVIADKMTGDLQRAGQRA